MSNGKSAATEQKSATADLRWGWPGAARKAHVFADGDAVALCQKWMFMGHMEDGGFSLGEKPGPDDCVACWRKAKAILDAHRSRSDSSSGVPL